MARCLRCNAGNEWLEGDVPKEYAAPAIESEAEKKAKEFYEKAMRYHIAPPDRFRFEALKIIRQLLAERGLK